MFLYIEKNAGHSNSSRVWQPKKVLYDYESDYQHITVLDTEDNGEVLFIDGQIQSAQSDEAIYHSWLVHPAMYIKALIHTSKRATRLWNVLVLGGGEGCTTRDVLNWYRVSDVTQIDIDKDLVDLFRGPMSYWNDSVYLRPEVEVQIRDAVEWAKTVTPLSEPLRDVVIMDLTEPAEFGDNWNIILRGVCMMLRGDGVLVGYMGTVGEDHHVEESCEWMQFCRALKGSFSTSSWTPIWYRVYMPSWGGYSLFFGAAKIGADKWKTYWDADDIISKMFKH